MSVLSKWTKYDVAIWLFLIPDASQYVERFKEYVDGDTLMKVDEREMQVKLNIQDGTHRLRILAAIHRLKLLLEPSNKAPAEAAVEAPASATAADTVAEVSVRLETRSPEEKRLGESTPSSPAGSKRKYGENSSSSPAKRSKQAEIDLGKDHERGLPAARLNHAYIQKKQISGTLSNKGVYVAVSDLIPGKPILGLFAGRDYKEGDTVTFYGGGVFDLTDARKRPASLNTHSFRLPGGMEILDGFSWAKTFRLPPDAESEQKLPEYRRMHIFPSKSQDRITDCSRERIMGSGVGYMCNTANHIEPRGRKRNNLRSTNIVINKETDLRTIIYVATCDIPMHAELLVSYNWASAELLKTLTG